MKRCFRCDRVLPLESFYRHAGMKDGHLNKCKDCCKDDTQQNRAKKRDRYAAYERARFRDPRRKKQVIEYRRRHRERHPEKAQARDAVNNAVRDGRLQRSPCEKCGNPKVQGHHDDYSRPLEVRWLCFACHRAEHGQTAALQGGSDAANRPF